MIDGSRFPAHFDFEGRVAVKMVVSLNSDENEISLYIVTTCSNNQAMRIKKVITKDKMS